MALDPDQANSGVPNALNKPMSDVRADRTGPTGAASVEWKTAMSRVTAPSTRSSYTMSAWLIPACGRASGSALSIFTTSAGLAASAGSGMGTPESGQVGGGGGGGVVGGAVVVVVGAVVVVSGAADSEEACTMTADATMRTASPTPAITLPRVVRRKARTFPQAREKTLSDDGGVPSPQPVLATPRACPAEHGRCKPNNHPQWYSAARCGSQGPTTLPQAFCPRKRSLGRPFPRTKRGPHMPR